MVGLTGRSGIIAGSSKQIVRVLLTCIGRRVELLRAFREAAAKLKVRIEIHGADASWMSPALHLVDRAHIVPSIDSGKYPNALLQIAAEERIDLLIPLIDSELPLIAACADRFAECGCRALISSPKVVETCHDKLQTYVALKKAGIDTPQTWDWRDAIELRRHRFPYYLKPRAGSAAMGNYVVNDLEELVVFGRRVPDAIVQEFVEGEEYTLDIYTGFDGKPRCVVPRRRIEVRWGEVSKGVTVKDKAIMAVGRRVAEALGECRGVVTVQCIRTAMGRIRVIEINPRFGGGAPLAIQAGADFPAWILGELLGRKPRISATTFRDGVTMLRYDEAVFVERASAAK